MGRDTTAADVARAANVSRAAVSLVLNNKDGGNVSPATRERILAAADELGYVPHPVARSLRTRRTMMIGLITDAIASSPFAGRLLSGAGERAREHGYLVTVFDSHQRPDLEQRAASELGNRRVDGIIYAPLSLRRIDALPNAGVPTVLANCFQDPDEHPTVIPDEERAGYAAADHLLSFGHRRIAVIEGITEIAGPMRLAGFLRRLAQDGITPEVAVLPDVWTIAEGYRVVGPLLDRPDPPQAIFCTNDRVAAGAVLAASALGLRVPDDVSIIGFDDQEELADTFVPALTTMALPHREMGEHAVDALLGLLGGRLQPPRRLLLEAPLITRASVGPAR